MRISHVWCLLSRRVTVVAAALLAVGSAHAAGGKLSTQAFVIPENPESAAMATKVATLVEQSLAKHPRYRVVDLSEVLGGKPGPAVESARAKARALLQAGIKFYDAIQFDPAIAKLKEAVALYREHAAWVHRFPEYTDALAYLAAAHILRGDDAEGRKVYKELLLYAPHFEIDGKRFDTSLQNIVSQVREAIASGPVGSFSVRSDPAGARVFVDNVQKGFTPASIDMIPTGTHIIRVEALGAEPYGEVVEIVPTEDKIVKAKLKPTPEFKGLRTLLDQIKREMAAGKVGPAMMKLGQFARLDHAVYGTVSQSFGEVRITLWVVAVGPGVRLATRRETFDDNEFTLAQNIDVMVRDLLADAKRREKSATASADPLDRRTGTEGWWNGEDKKEGARSLEVGTSDTTSGDPLDSMDGTEDW